MPQRIELEGFLRSLNAGAAAAGPIGREGRGGEGERALGI